MTQTAEHSSVHSSSSMGACDSAPPSSSALPEAMVSQQTPHSVWLGRKSSTNRAGLTMPSGRAAQGSARDTLPCPVGSSKQLILCRRQLQGREMRMLCMSLLLQPWGCLLLQPTARNFQKILLIYMRPTNCLEMLKNYRSWGIKYLSNLNKIAVYCINWRTTLSSMLSASWLKSMIVFSRPLSSPPPKD